MTVHPDSADRSTHRPHHFGDFLYRVGRVVLVGVLFLLFYFLAQSMVHHRFFEGGWYNRNGAISP